MEKLVVHGGFTLRGAVNISGSKNASLPILAASLLTDEPVVVRRVPDVSDTNFMVQIMGQLGASVERSSGNVRVEAKNLHSEAAYEQVRKMRASICLLGPLMARMQRCVIPLPGGCVIGDRPVDLHIRAIQALGATVQIERGNLIIEAPRGLKGATVDLNGDHGPTVLGTDNLMMAAVLAKGTTVIESAAAEPEVVDLANFLIKMGANIQGAGTRRIVIEGVEKLRGCNHTVIPDRIEAGTFMVAAAMMGDGVTLRRVCEEHMSVITDLLRRCGHHVEFNERGDTVTIIAGKMPKSGEIKTAPYPGYPTDMQAQMTALFATTPGISVVKDTIFPQRFMHCSELKRMGANIKGAGTDIIRIRGVRKLHGTEYSIIPDQIEAGTFMFAAAATGGDVTVKNVIPKHLEATTAKLEEIGCEVQEFDDAVRVRAVGRLHRTHVKTLPYPGYPTDMQPQIAVTLALAEGTSIVTESIFENRFKYADELSRMGACIKVEGNSAIIDGVNKLTGARVSAPDLRAGAALVIAGLAAEGITIVDLSLIHI